MCWHGWGQSSSHFRASLDDLNSSANLTEPLKMGRMYENQMRYSNLGSVIHKLWKFVLAWGKPKNRIE